MTEYGWPTLRALASNISDATQTNQELTDDRVGDPVTDEYDPNLRLGAMPSALVSDAEGGKRKRTTDTWELGGVTDDDTTCTDVVINERNAFFRTVHSQDRNERKTGRMTRRVLSDLSSVSSRGIEAHG